MHSPSVSEGSRCSLVGKGADTLQLGTGQCFTNSAAVRKGTGRRLSLSVSICDSQFFSDQNSMTLLMVSFKLAKGASGKSLVSVTGSHYLPHLTIENQGHFKFLDDKRLQSATLLPGYRGASTNEGKG